MRVLTLICAAALLAGCDDQMTIPQVTVTLTPTIIRYDLGPRYAREFQLADGTRCVTQDSAITCEWHQPGVLVPRVQ